jgi:mannose-1-phosphate guanylyltransferase
LTADHIIEPAAEFLAALDRGFVLAASPDRLVTFGIVPTQAHTGLGYVETGDPLAEDAGRAWSWPSGRSPTPRRRMAYLTSGRHLWNSGMFVWRADSVLDRLAAHLPGAHADLTRIAKAWNTDQRGTTLSSLYPTLPKISIDYAVMEPASRDPVWWSSCRSMSAGSTSVPGRLWRAPCLWDEDGNAVSATLTALEGPAGERRG